MKSDSSNLRIRNAVDRLAELIDQPAAQLDRPQWMEELNAHLEQLEQALGDEAYLNSDFFKKTARSHPRLLSTCAAFFEDGRQLLRQATVVVLLSVRGQNAAVAPPEPLREATATLLDAVRKHQRMASQLMVEASQEIGGEG